jgi:hypothetical protein
MGGTVLTMKGEPLCESKIALLANYDKAAQVYAEMVAELYRQVGVVNPSEFKKLYERMKMARKNAAATMLAFENHLTDHGC